MQNWFKELSTASKVMVAGLAALFMVVFFVFAVGLVTDQEIGPIDVAPHLAADAGVDGSN